MKTFTMAAILAVSSIFGGSAVAQELAPTQKVALAACTKDGKTATLIVGAAGTVSYDGANERSVASTMQENFTRTARHLNAEELVSPKGARLFQSLITVTSLGAVASKDAERSFNGAPVISNKQCVI